MLLVDKDIKILLKTQKLAVISLKHEMPFDEFEQIAGASIDLRLNNQVRRYKSSINDITLETKDATDLKEFSEDEEIIIQPNEIILATTLEAVILPPDIAGLITGRSSIARLGLMVQVTQDLMQAGHHQAVPLQLVNITSRPIRIKPYIRICQIILFRANSNADFPYGSKSNAKYSNELLSPKESGIHTEINPSYLDREKVNINLQQTDLQKDIESIKKEVSQSNQDKDLSARLASIMAIVYTVLGAAAGSVISEVNTVPFPSAALITSSVIVIICVALIIAANWKRS